MARVTVEDCVEVVPNRFELVVLASERARNIAAGSMITLDRDNDKNPVVALREIAERTINTDVLREAVIQQNQRYANFEPEIDESQTDMEESSMNAQLVDELRAFSHEDAELDDAGDFSFSDDDMDVDD